jgi:hypothetical protein
LRPKGAQGSLLTDRYLTEPARKGEIRTVKVPSAPWKPEWLIQKSVSVAQYRGFSSFWLGELGALAVKNNLFIPDRATNLSLV